MSVPLNQLIYQRVKRLHKEIASQLWQSQQSLNVAISPLQKKAIDLRAAKKEKYTAIASGDVFSPAQLGPHGEFPWFQRWFKIDIPAAKASEKGRRYLEWLAHGESTIYVDGKPWAGLDCAHPDAPLPDKKCTIYLDCGLWQTGIWDGYNPPAEDGFVFRYAHQYCRFHQA